MLTPHATFKRELWRPFESASKSQLQRDRQSSMEAAV